MVRSAPDGNQTSFVTTYLLDTDVAAELLRERYTRAKRLATKDRDAVFISAVTIAELTLEGGAGDFACAFFVIFQRQAELPA